METMSFAERKSRLVHQRADRKAPDWRAVGSVTILAPEFDRPLYLEGVGYTVFFREAKQDGELREAVVLLNRLKQHPISSILYWCMVGMGTGAALMRAWIYWP